MARTRKSRKRKPRAHGAQKGRATKPGPARRSPTGSWIAVGAVAAATVVGLVVLLSREPQPKADPEDAEQVALGATVYAAQCASCHGANLEGQRGWRRPLPSGKVLAPPHNATGHTWHHPDKHLFRVTKLGTEAIARPGYKSDMIAFGDKLSDEEIWAVLAYIKSNWPPEIRRKQEMVNERAR
jgi:mono/diheme cytochrome c family protein